MSILRGGEVMVEADKGVAGFVIEGGVDAIAGGMELSRNSPRTYTMSHSS